MDRKNYQEILTFEKIQYFEKFGLSRFGYLKTFIFREPVWSIMNWQKCSRKCDYYSSQRGFISKIKGQLYRFLRNYYGQKMNIEASTTQIGKGLLLYHSGVIINSSAIIGENVHFHGHNCVGNAGQNDNRCPIIGNNVTIGIGAKIIGNIEIADGIIIGAGAVVVKSFTTPNVTIAGVPARIIS